jgi:spore coat polysaccharide biosynthesis protein SpsF
LVRLSGDSPLLDPALVDRAVALFRLDAADLVSNVASRTFPKGQSVEVLSRQALARAVAAMTTRYEREHVTPYLYAHPDDFVIRSFTATVPRPEVQLSVDDASDFERCEAILSSLGRPSWEAGWEECVRASDALAARVRP